MEGTVGSRSLLETLHATDAPDAPKMARRGIRVWKRGLGHILGIPHLMISSK